MKTFLFILLYSLLSISKENVYASEPDSIKIKRLISLSKKYIVPFPDSTKIYADSAISLGNKVGDMFTVATGYKLIGVSYFFRSMSDSAMIEYKKSRQLFAQIPDSLEIAAVDLAIGQCARSTGDFDKSIGLIFSALKYFEKVKYEKYISIAYDELAQVYSISGNHKQALVYFKKAHALSLTNDNPLYLANTTGNLGSVYNYLGHYDSAKFYLHAAIKLYDETGNVGAYGNSNQTLGNIHSDLGNYDSAIYHYNEAVISYQKVEYPKGMCEVLHNMGNLANNNLYFDSALSYFNQSIEYGKSIDDVLLVKLNYESMSKSYEGLGKYKQALEFHKKYYDLSDSLLNIATNTKIEELKVEYETEKKEEKINSQLIEITSQKAINAKNFMLIIALSLSIILLIFIGILLKNRLQKKQQVALQRKDIDFKELQISAVIDSQEKERKRFATDLHDGFGQLISILKLNVESIEQQKDKDKRHTLFEKSTNILNEMYGELRNICFNLMPESLVKFGLIPSLNEFADKINDSEKVIVEVLSFDMKKRLTDLQEISLYRITQEWVNNILKYSDAENITIQITKDEYEITLTIEDNGTGFDLEKLTESKGNGWKNIRSRANLIQADLEIDTTPNIKGNMLMVNLPVKDLKMVEA